MMVPGTLFVPTVIYPDHLSLEVNVISISWHSHLKVAGIGGADRNTPERRVSTTGRVTPHVDATLW